MEQLSGQLDFNFYNSNKCDKIKVPHLCEFINSLGEAQYSQIGRVISNTCEREGYEMPSDSIARITNDVSVWLLNIGNMYLKHVEMLQGGD